MISAIIISYFIIRDAPIGVCKLGVELMTMYVVRNKTFMVSYVDHGECMNRLIDYFFYFS